MTERRKSLLELRTHDAVARIAGRHLDAASRGLIRLGNPDDPKGLHAFRTAVRRLRSLLRAYGPWLGRVAGRKVRRRLRELTQATNAGRDADVQLDWLSTQREQFTAEERPGQRWLSSRLRARKRRAYQSAGAKLSREFAGIVQLIGKRIGDADDAAPRQFRVALLEVLDPMVAGLRQRLAAISAPDDEKNVHRSRIQVKRLRYLIEPLRNELAEAQPVVRLLKELQTVLGDLHDMHVLEAELATAVEEAATEKARRLHRLALDGDEKLLKREHRRDEGPGLVMLAARARDRRDAHYSDLRRNWLANRVWRLQPDLDSLRRALLPPDRTADRPRASPQTGVAKVRPLVGASRGSDGQADFKQRRSAKF
jgi:CHAD domain-containing protein